MVNTYWLSVWKVQTGNPFFAVAESPNGIDNFRFWKRPITLPDINPAETNVYDMRLTAHEDGWIYGKYFAVNAMTTVHRPATFRQQWAKGRYCPYQGFGGMGTFAGPEVLQSAAERSASS